MIYGLLYGFCLGLFGLFWYIYGYITEKWLKTIFLIVISFLIPMIIGAEIGKYETKNEYLKYIESYKLKKEIIENEIKDKSVEELEKIGLFSDIVYVNSKLAEEKIEYQKWYYYYLDYSLIESLKPIVIVEENK